jgi:hypothetical protein
MHEKEPEPEPIVERNGENNMLNKYKLRNYSNVTTMLDRKFAEFSHLQERMDRLKQEIVKLEEAALRLHDTLPLDYAAGYRKKYGPLFDKARSSDGKRKTGNIRFVVEKMAPKMEFCSICDVLLPLVPLDDERGQNWVIRGEKVCEKCFMIEVTKETGQSGSGDEVETSSPKRIR